MDCIHDDSDDDDEDAQDRRDHKNYGDDIRWLQDAAALNQINSRIAFSA